MPGAVNANSLFEDTLVFLTELEENNNREWFQDHKTRYDTQIKRPAEGLMGDVAHWLAARHGTLPKAKLFRPYRDVRFSADKTPYHTHVHILWSLPDGRSWMTGISPSYATAGCGVMGFERDQLDQYRAAIDRNAGAEIETLLVSGHWRLEEPELKRVPPPYPQDHRHAQLLRRKSLVAWHDDLQDALRDDPGQALKDVFKEMAEVHEWLGRTLC
ncbi:DUF2461 domain-containing protein [Pelagimonas varians]|uniref:TIGR02453 family protein n=1 Tax=Pelagimonas varians TaxID=696760 RepID=A0A238KV84_9RHOB|nr:DUF2461 domain-containing protein [Pelagimonas varians]PYG28348.1 uncharacterized protein (TIGR02453 family) [Pelagimonas varians]SMX46550.1 hypothetical protein PEV8663_03324 [Pelagimonas varians]